MRRMWVVSGIAATALSGLGLVTAQMAAANSPELVDGKDGMCRSTPFSVYCDQPRNPDGSWTRCVRKNASFPGFYEPATTICYTLRPGDLMPVGTAPDYIGAD
jgi:hypothetical protein